MQEHGDDFDVWCAESGDVGGWRSDEEWLSVARFVRHAANKLLAEDLPLCLPGEPRQCGRPARQHVLAWGAVLKAAAQQVIEDASPSPAHSSYAGQTLYHRSLAELRAHSTTARTPAPGGG
ncbi:hypothetical protein [Streptomyces phytohabitans]|uniref:hypothetical protein n=1 Tax=Streptomyces phytohabitans TaxID=1150371 RepID=UPI00345B7493